TRRQFRDQFDDKDFTFDLLGKTPTVGGGGIKQGLDVRDLPSLHGEGVALTLFTLDPCGINLPHVHPRATEILYVISGAGRTEEDWQSYLQVAFVEENGGRTIVNTIGTGEATFFPEGLIHYQQNLGCEQVQYISGLNHEDPGVLTVSTRTFTFPDKALAATFNIEVDEVKALRDGLPTSPAAGQAACLEYCGM
ncbi:unnamed protein product, partial [Heterosigma akashiwo]